MDSEVEQCLPILLKKSVDTNKFISSNAVHALLEMIHGTGTIERTMVSVMNQIPGMKNAAIRCVIAQVMHECLTIRLKGAFFQKKQLVPKFMQNLGELSKEGHSECRMWVKQTVQSLLYYHDTSKEDFKKFVQKNVNDKIYQELCKIIDKG